MKAPKYPQRPYPPYKPIIPLEKIQSKIPIKSISLDKYKNYSIQEFMDLINLHLFASSANFDHEAAQINFNVNETWDYDDVTCNVELDIFFHGMIDNPGYKFQYEEYCKGLIKYEDDLKKYEPLLDQYNKDMIIYEVEIEKYALQQAKDTVKKLEKKLKGK